MWPGSDDLSGISWEGISLEVGDEIALAMGYLDEVEVGDILTVDIPVDSAMKFPDPHPDDVGELPDLFPSDALWPSDGLYPVFE